MKILNSQVEEIEFNTFKIYLKRDDLLNSDFSGNKARKFHYFLEHDFPKIKRVVSYGSNQSNAMYSISVLCKIKNWEFIYYVDHISSYLKENPQGNYKGAIKNGANIIENKEFGKNFDDTTLFINEGGAIKESEYGVKVLAKEIEEFAKKNKKENLEIFLPSGTGTTALYLQKNISYKVLTCACVGDSEYLKKQFLALEANLEKYPTILDNNKKYHFGKLYKEFYLTYKELLKQTNIEFDLLYDPLGFIVLQDYLKQNPKKEILYIHQGGILGNVTMLERYKRKFK